jgi:CYTH domain-containing protein
MGAPTMRLGEADVAGIGENVRMAVEIERKFLVETLTGVQLDRGVEIRQGYLAEEGDVEVRVRIADGAATLTVKAGDGLRRVEVECPLEADEAEALWLHTAGRRLEKRRHRVPVGDVVAEVDVYGGAHDGLLVAEVEFPTEDAAAAFEAPDWFGEEVTGRPQWKNANLARRG